MVRQRHHRQQRQTQLLPEGRNHLTSCLHRAGVWDALDIKNGRLVMPFGLHPAAPGAQPVGKGICNVGESISGSRNSSWSSKTHRRCLYSVSSLLLPEQQNPIQRPRPISNRVVGKQASCENMLTAPLYPDRLCTSGTQPGSTSSAIATWTVRT